MRSLLASVDRALTNRWLARISNLWFVFGIVAAGWGFLVQQADVGPGSILTLVALAVVFGVSTGGALRKHVVNRQMARSQSHLSALPRLVTGEHVAETPLAVNLRLDTSPFATFAVDNSGPTIRDARINLLAPYRKGALFGRFENGSPAPGGKLDVVDHEVTDGIKQAYRWREHHLEIHGFSITEWEFSLPIHSGDTLLLKIGADEFGGWFTWEGDVP